MERLPSDSREEHMLRLENTLVSIEAYNPETAADKMKAKSHFYTAGCSLTGGFIANLVGNFDQAESLFAGVIPHSRMAVAENKYPFDDNKLQCALFSYAMLLGYVRQIDESANLLISVGVSKESRFRAPSIFYVIVAHLWRGETDSVLALLNELEKLENKKMSSMFTRG